MEYTKKTLKNHGLFLGLCVLFLGIGIVLSTTWLRYQLNPDSTAYFSIAEKYAHFNLRSAINGYWSPLLSWLLVPWVWLDVNLLVASKITATLCCLVILVGAYRFLLYRKVAKSIALLTSLLLSLFLVDMLSIQASSRDLLMAAVATTFVLHVIRFDDSPSRKKAIWLGLLGALMFYAKALGFYLFLGVILGLAFWQWRKSRKNTQLIFHRFAPALITFFALTLPFIGLISLKYGQPTLSTVGGFAYSIYSPASKGGAFPIGAPLMPTNSTAMWYWEDPTDVIELIPEHDWELHHNKAYYLKKIVWANASLTVKIVDIYGPIVAFGFLVAILGMLKKGPYRKDYVVFAGIALVWVAGHMLIMTDSRYLITAGVLPIIPIGLWVEQLRRARVILSRQIVVGAIIIAIVGVMTLVPSLTRLRYDERPYYKVAQAVSGQMPEDSKVISEQFNAYYVCYYLRLKCLGVIALQENPADYYRILKNAGVEYYLYGHSQDDNAKLNEFTETYFVKMSDQEVDGKPVTLYKIK